MSCLTFLGLVLATAGVGHAILDDGAEIRDELQSTSEEHVLERLFELLDSQDQASSEAKECILSAILRPLLQRSPRRVHSSALFYQPQRFGRETRSVLVKSRSSPQFWKMMKPQRFGKK